MMRGRRGIDKKEHFFPSFQGRSTKVREYSLIQEEGYETEQERKSDSEFEEREGCACCAMGSSLGRSHSMPTAAPRRIRAA